MLKIDIIACGRLRASPLLDLYQDYLKRIRWSLTLHEIESKKKNAKEDEASQILSKLNKQAFIFVLDEKGKSLKSSEFSNQIKTLTNQGQSHFQFVIGGADGLSQKISDQSDFLLSFGKQTWPHMLARVMLLEQIYRTQQILTGHPYHRD